jgi:hypothetical protein
VIIFTNIGVREQKKLKKIVLDWAAEVLLAENAGISLLAFT